MKTNLFFRYFVVDLKRAFVSWRFLGGMIGIFLTLEFAAIESKQWHVSVLNTFWLVTYSTPFLLILIFTTFVFGQCFCEDLEHRYIRLLVIRGSLKLYTLSKVLVLMISCIVTMTAAILLFAAVLHIQYPWITLKEDTYQTLQQYGSFRYFLKNENFVFYYLFSGIQYGIFAGIMAIAAALFSLLYHDRLFVLSVPLILWYCIQYYGAALFQNPKFNLDRIFNVNYNVWSHDLLSFLYACFVGILLSIGMGICIYKIIKKQMI